MTSTETSTSTAHKLRDAASACINYAKGKGLIDGAGLPAAATSHVIASDLLDRLSAVKVAAETGFAEIAADLPTFCYLAGVLLTKASELRTPTKSNVPDQRPIWLVAEFTTMNLKASQAAKS